MNYQLPEQINSTDDVYQFFRYLYHIENTCFHPDDSFDGYINIETKEQAFSDETCKKYDKLMDQAHEVCKKVSPSLIYEIGMEIDETPDPFPDCE